MGVSNSIQRPINSSTLTINSFDHPVHTRSRTAVAHKGLENRGGDNNCFLNVVLQVLWHTDAFRMTLEQIIESERKIEESMSSIKTNSVENEFTLLKAVCELFADYRQSTSKVLQPNQVREALWLNSGQFQSGEIADANETIDTILQQLHNEDGKCGGPEEVSTCLAHRIFGGSLLTLNTCSTCHATSEPQIPKNFLRYVYASEIIEISKTMDKSELSFGELIRKGVQLDKEKCPDKIENNSQCHGESTLKTWCFTPPLVLAIAVTWSSASETSETLEQFISVLSPRICLSDIFSMEEKIPKVYYTFRGLICYYGLHYVSIFQDVPQSAATSSLRSPTEFLLLDDSRIRSLGQWANVVDEVVRSRYQPVLIIYEIAEPFSVAEIIPSLTAQPKSAFETKSPPSHRHTPHIWERVEAAQREKKAEVKYMKHGARANVSQVSSDVKDCRNGTSKTELTPEKQSDNGRVVHNLVRVLEEVRVWGTEYKEYTVFLSSDTSGPSREYGLMVEKAGSELVVTSFHNNAASGRRSIAEENGSISLMDTLLSINDNDVSAADADRLHELMSVHPWGVKLTLRSSYQKSLWFQCYHCQTKNILSESRRKDLEKCMKVTCSICESELLWEQFVVNS